MSGQTFGVLVLAVLAVWLLTRKGRAKGCCGASCGCGRKPQAR